MSRRRRSQRELERIFSGVPPGHRPKPPAHRKPRKDAKVHFQAKTIEGQLVLKGKFGFVLSEKTGVPDIYVQGDTLRLAMGGDRVAVKLSSSSDPSRPEGEIVRVVSRARSSVVGVFRKIRKAFLIEPENGGEPVRILDFKGAHPQEGDLAVVKITQWPTPDSWAGGELLEVLGSGAGPGMELKAILRKFELPDAFPAAVQAQAKSFAEEVPESAWQGRETFFHIPVFTIDGADAKDFDDAVSLEDLADGGWRLGVHIADVAQYVSEGSDLDIEAYRRGTSIYFVDKVVPMLPTPLSDNLCSLRPDVARLTLSCVMDINPQGRVVNHRIVESAIRSAKRFTYENVELILKGEDGANAPAPVTDAVKKMGRLARLLREMRFKRGSLDFDFPEAYIVTDAADHPVDVRRRERLESHRLIEEFMLLANETVATEMRKFPFLYRVHERPDAFKMGKLEDMLKALGVAVPPGFHQGRPLVLQSVLESVKGKPIEGAIQMMILRSLKQAVYSSKNEGHYGLASACYTHFTSPIRRYPDLIVHRIIKERLRQHLSAQRQEYWKTALADIGLLSSQRERTAVDAEREYMDLKKVQVMEKHLGESFDGVVSSVTSFGLFVELNDIFVEGLVHVSNLRDDYYVYDEARSTLRGRRTGRLLSMGQRVRVRLAAANTVKRQLDFELEPAKPSPGHKPAGRRTNR
ncbi:MAG: ribonuclease R [Elusimicrobia bacterium]|nr:ribonuclease R [Elusimicrobiota bacterium]